MEQREHLTPFLFSSNKIKAKDVKVISFKYLTTPWELLFHLIVAELFDFIFTLFDFYIYLPSALISRLSWVTMISCHRFHCRSSVCYGVLLQRVRSGLNEVRDDFTWNMNVLNRGTLCFLFLLFEEAARTRLGK